jgi:hypothetical protein
MKSVSLYPIVLLVFLGMLFGPMAGMAVGSNVLMINVHGPNYDADGLSIYNTLVAAGATADYVNLSASGQVVTALGAKEYDQVWVFDLSNWTDNYATDYAAIAAWHNARPDNEIICDGRMISSYWSGRWATEGQKLTENYYENMDDRGGGLMLGTDHDAYHSGINQINAGIGLNPFVGNFSLATIPVDTASPLMTVPNDMGTHLFDDSSPGQTPYGLQPSGDILYTVAWHSNNHDTPGISSTIEGVIGMHVDITAPANNSEFWDSVPIDLSAVATGGTDPVAYAWTSGVDPLGTGANLQIPAGTLPLGQSTIRVVATDDGTPQRIDDDTIQINIVPRPATQITAPTTDLKDGAPLETATVTAYGDAKIGGLYGIYLRGEGVGGAPNYRWSISGGPELLPWTTLATVVDTDLDGTLDEYFLTFLDLVAAGANDRDATSPYTLRLEPLDGSGLSIVGSDDSEILLLVPEPTTLSLMFLAGLAVLKRRRG